MSALQGVRQKLSHTELVESLTDRQRRQILRTLREEPEPVSERELAERLVLTDGAKSIEDVAEVTIEGVRIQLQHAHLPRLDDVGLVEWSRDDETVAVTEDPVWEDAEFQRLLEIDDDDWDELAASEVDGRLRTIVSALESGESVRRDVLAHRVAAHEADAESWADSVESVRSELHHVHLPKLEGAGLLEYDADCGTVTYRDPSSAGGWEQ